MDLAYQKVAEPQHPHMATLIKAMQAVLGYTPVNWPTGQYDLIVRGHALEGLEDRLLLVRCQGVVAR